MDELSYWSVFTDTGRVEDYLEYVMNKDCDGKDNRRMEQSNAEFSNSDGYDSENGTYR